MSDEIDTNKLVVDFVQANLDRIADAFSSAFKFTRNRLRAHLDQTYSAYLTRLLNRYSRSKSFFVRSEPLFLYDFYIPLDLHNQQRTLSTPGGSDIAAVASSAVITGTGGAGKSLFMRHLLIDTIKSQQKAPVFLELRHMNKNGRPLVDQILTNLRSSGLNVDADYLNLALKFGHFCILLDGFDELEPDRRDPVSKQIRELSEQYPENWIVLSSRPDVSLEGWANFVKLDIEPLDLDRAVQLVQKVPFDDAIKSKFIEDLSNGLYDRHRSFLSNPLLLSIMLLTYSDNAHIPGKLSLFYSQAYESLFQKHDALKGGFQRDRRTTLDIQDFGKVFAAFCLQTYDKGEFSFSRTAALNYLSKAKSISRIECNREAFLDDAIQAVCLLIEDGLQIVFAHRSFQEYFVAKFIQESNPTIKGKLVNRYKPKPGNDTIMGLMYELEPNTVEEYYILIEIDRIKDCIAFKKKLGMTHFLRFLKITYLDFRLEKVDEPRVIATIKGNGPYSAVSFIRRHVMRGGTGEPKRKTDDRGLAKILLETYRKRRVPTSAFKITDAYVRELAVRGPWVWNMQFLEDLVSLGDVIRQRQREAAESLDSILQ